MIYNPFAKGFRKDNETKQWKGEPSTPKRPRSASSSSNSGEPSPKCPCLSQEPSPDSTQTEAPGPVSPIIPSHRPTSALLSSAGAFPIFNHFSNSLMPSFNPPFHLPMNPIYSSFAHLYAHMNPAAWNTMPPPERTYSKPPPK